MPKNYHYNYTTSYKDGGLMAYISIMTEERQTIEDLDASVLGIGIELQDFHAPTPGLDDIHPGYMLASNVPRRHMHWNEMQL